MEKKQKYIAPAVLDDLLLEMEGQILYASRNVADEDFDEVETMGQSVSDLSSEGGFNHTWEN